MALWLKQEDGTLVNVTGDGSSGGGDGGDAGPHDHAEYAPVAHDHDDLTINMPSDHKYKGPGTVFVVRLGDGPIGGIGRGGKTVTTITSNGYPSSDGSQWKSFGVVAGGEAAVGATQLDLRPLGGFDVRVAEEYPTGSAYAGPPVQFTVTESGPTFRAMPSKTRTVDDVLERAETAEFPPEDDEGVTTMDGYDEVPLFEVVSALLGKVKELSAEIKELKGA
jgi:hypothetical protein